ncbi:MAG: YHS domain-containing protein [Candidatus Omnitrophica bacterium]|nr:YHS domain-containing protein [Candidatus Omnitrophota bacterium]MBU4303584.1 YHS domain-containing protein [Candidatus Omnitrophota bacterium]MBU4418591.1 YHS domain-containing protein [Candidatus Omnitrophota bacterium]MBU4467533.1 YHS domain-containing protein [Candidatus Omnitrophota bacterium]MCG2707468.1 YHS domain-containing protein [Candidatus Omnitrophota bacterium]
MFRGLLVALILAVFIFGADKLSFAQHDHSEHGHGTGAVVADAVSREAMNPVRNLDESLLSVSNGVNVDNKICPVSGEKIEEKMKAVYEYKGKIYNFCCASCVDDFKKDPQKYIKKVEAELQSVSKGEPAHEEHEMGSM